MSYDIFRASENRGHDVFVRVSKELEKEFGKPRREMTKSNPYEEEILRIYSDRGTTVVLYGQLTRESCKRLEVEFFPPLEDEEIFRRVKNSADTDSEGESVSR